MWFNTLLFLLVILFIGNVQPSFASSKNNNNIVRIRQLKYSYPEKNCSSSLLGKPLCTSCTSYKICMPNVEFPGNSCPSDTPYCVQTKTQAVCASKPDLQIDVCRNILEMPNPINCEFGLNYEPDAKTCNYYHYCPRQGQLSTVYPCPENHHFNDTTGRCTSNKVQKCNVVNCCSGSGTLFSQYGDGFNRWYAYCNTLNNNVTMYRCRPNFKMNYKKSICEFLCPRQGTANYCDKDDYSIYYECTGPENSWDQVMKIKQCPPRSSFNLDHEECTDDYTAGITQNNPSKYKSCNYSNRV